jgi:hypothetical protein
VRRTIIEVLSEFRSVKVPKEYIFDVFPAMRPRHFSIASSVAVSHDSNHSQYLLMTFVFFLGHKKRHPHEIHLCVAVVRYRTKLKIGRKGVATSYLTSLADGRPTRISVRNTRYSLRIRASHSCWYSARLDELAFGYQDAYNLHRTWHWCCAYARVTRRANFHWCSKYVRFQTTLQPA